MNKLALKEIGVTVSTPVITFTAYEKLKDEAIDVAEKLQCMEVTPQNLKETKKILANARRTLDHLAEKRLEVKRFLLAPYEIFAEQVREIDNIVRGADELQRTKVRGIEEREREERRERASAIWDKRAQEFTVPDFVTFDRFITPQLLNKGISVNTIEAEISNYLNTIENDLETISQMQNSLQIMQEYADTLNLSQALALYYRREREREEAEADRMRFEAEESERLKQEEATRQAADYLEKSADHEAQAAFHISGKSNIEKVRQLLEEARVDYSVELID